MNNKKNIFLFFAILISVFIFNSDLVCGSRITNDYQPYSEKFLTTAAVAGDRYIPSGSGEFFSLVNTTNGIYVIYPYLTGSYYQLGYKKSSDNGASWSALNQITVDNGNKSAPRVLVKEDLIYIFYAKNNSLIHNSDYAIDVAVFNSSSNSLLYTLDLVNLILPAIRVENGWGDVGVLTNGTLYFYDINFTNYYFQLHYFDELTNMTHLVFNRNESVFGNYYQPSYQPTRDFRIRFYNDTYFAIGQTYEYGDSGYFHCNGTQPDEVVLSLTNDGGLTWFSNTTYNFSNCYRKNFWEFFFDNSANLHLLRGINISNYYLLTHEIRTKSSGVWTQLSINEFITTPVADFDNDIFDYSYFDYILGVNSSYSFGNRQGTYFENSNRSTYGFFYPNRNGGINYAIYNETSGKFKKGALIEGVSCNTDFAFPRISNTRNEQDNNISDMLHIGVVRLIDSTCYEYRSGLTVFEWLPLFNQSPNYLEFYNFDLNSLLVPATSNCTLNYRINSTCLCAGVVVDACYFDALNCLDSWCCSADGGVTIFGGTYAICIGASVTYGGGTTNASGGILQTSDTSNIADFFGLKTTGQRLLAGTFGLLIVAVGLAVVGMGAAVILICLVIAIFAFYAMGFIPAWVLYLLAILGVSGIAVMAKGMFGGSGN